MDLSLTHEQTQIKGTAEEFLERELPKARVRELFESETGFAPDIWESMAGHGWTSIVIPPEYGGQGESFTTLGVLYEEPGAALCPSPHLSSAVLCASAILEAGSNQQKENLLPSIASGDRIVAMAFTESDGGWGPESVQTTAVRQDGGFVINGTKMYVPDAHLADRLLIVARTSPGTGDGGITVFDVEPNSDGLSIRPHSGWLGDKLNEVSLNNLSVPVSSVVGEVDGAWPALQTAIDRATAVLCAYMMGGCRRVLEMSIEHCRNRTQFGVPIGTFQRVQDRLIEALNMEQAARWTTYEALWKLDQDRPDASQAISMAKAVASDGYVRACEAAHHIHAGVGVDMEFGLAYYTQKARTLQHYLGDASFHRRRMAQLMEL